MVSVPYQAFRSVTPDQTNVVFDNRRPPEADAFGAGVGRGLSGLGQALDQVQKSFTALDLASKNDARERTNFNLQAGLTEFEQSEQQRLATVTRDATGTNASNMYLNFMKEHDKLAQERMAAVPAVDRERFGVAFAKIKAGLQGQAFGAEMKIRDTTQGTNLKTGFDNLVKTIQDNPDKKEDYVQNGHALIDATNFPEGTKAELRRAWDDQANYAYGMAMVKRDPQAVKDALEPGNSYFAKLRGAESSGNDQARAGTSTAYGRYQFLDGTWKQVVNSAEGRQAGLTMDGRGSPDQEEKAIRIFTGWNQKKLEANGIPVTQANLYAMHFLGEGDGLEFLRAVNSVTETTGPQTAASIVPNAAASNRAVFYNKDGSAKSLGDVYDWMVRKFGGAKYSGMDGVGQALNSQARAQLGEAADRQIAGNAAAQANAQQQAQAAWYNGAQIQASQGQLGHADIDSAIQAGQLTQYSQIHALREIVDKFNKNTDLSTKYAAAAADPQFGWNRVNPEHQDMANASYDKQKTGNRDKDLQTGQAIWQKTGIMPKGMAVEMRGALAGPDGAQALRAMQVLAQMQINADQTGADPFASVKEGKKELEDAASFFKHKVVDLGYKGAEAAQMWAQNNDPEYRNKVKPKDEQVKQFRDDMTKNALKDVTSLFTQGMIPLLRTVPKLGDGGAQHQSVVNTFVELAEDNYAQYGDVDRAKAFARDRMSAMFGVREGVLRQYPPEKAGGIPALPNGDRTWVYQAAADHIKEQTGITVDPKKVIFMAGPGTAEAFSNGEVPPYRIFYTRELNGQQVITPLMGEGKLVPEMRRLSPADYEKAKAKLSEETRMKLEATRAQEAARSEQLQDPMSFSVAPKAEGKPSSKSIDPTEQADLEDLRSKMDKFDRLGPNRASSHIRIPPSERQPSNQQRQR